MASIKQCIGDESTCSSNLTYIFELASGQNLKRPSPEDGRLRALDTCANEKVRSKKSLTST